MSGHEEPRDIADFTTLDSFLEGQGMREEIQTTAIREVLAWQMEQVMQATGLSRAALARRLNTSPAQVGRLLNPEDGDVALATLQRAAAMMGCKLLIDLA